MKYRAYDMTSRWQGPVRETILRAQTDADARNAGACAQGGYGTAFVVAERDGRCMDPETGMAIYPAHGNTCGAEEWD